MCLHSGYCRTYSMYCVAESMSAEMAHDRTTAVQAYFAGSLIDYTGVYGLTYQPLSSMQNNPSNHAFLHRIAWPGAVAFQFIRDF